MGIPREPRSQRGLRRDYTPPPQITRAYILGALHDASSHKTTYRICQKSREYVELIAQGIKKLGGNAWVYKEGKQRQLYVVEFSKSFLKDVAVRTLEEKSDYIRAYFDTDGGIAKESTVRYYIYFCQKDYNDLLEVKLMLKELEIQSGKIHNPSKRVDPDYWRFYISASSYHKFATVIGSSHPEKYVFVRMKI